MIKWDLASSGIYCIKNIINGKVYIGKSTHLYRRKYQHFTALKKGKHSNTYLQASFNKHDFNSFVFEVLEQCNVNELSIKEHYWINLFDSCNRAKGYNLEIVNSDGSNSRCYDSLNRMRKTIKTNKEKYIKPRGKDNPTSKEVYQYSLNGQFIQSFESCHIAAENLGCKERFTVISKCARNETGASFGYQWRYYKQDKINEYIDKNKIVLKENSKKQSKPIISLNLTTGEKVEYESISSASELLNLTISCVSRIANGQRKVSKKLNLTFFYK
jgi:group I intron endonuclease